MRDTVVAIIISQTPIALACLWVAWEARAIRNALNRLVVATERLQRADRDA